LNPNFSKRPNSSANNQRTNLNLQAVSTNLINYEDPNLTFDRKTAQTSINVFNQRGLSLPTNNFSSFTKNTQVSSAGTTEISPELAA
jgi:hypothetical protein